MQAPSHDFCREVRSNEETDGTRRGGELSLRLHFGRFQKLVISQFLIFKDSKAIFFNRVLYFRGF